MSGPAMRALKQRFGAPITLLTSRAGSGIVPFLPEVDGVIVADLPWVRAGLDAQGYAGLVERIREMAFDLAVIFTVYSQSALPAALLCWQARIAARLAYCRENPYGLLTHWVPDEEPYTVIRHQVERDLRLVQRIGATVADDRLKLNLAQGAAERCTRLLTQAGVDTHRPWIVLHPGVSEAKREYPLSLWVEVARLLRRKLGVQLVVTGSAKERALAGKLCVEEGIHCVAGRLDMEGFIATIAEARLVVSVNTVTTHLCAATNTPVVVLYAQTNPQHTPWKVASEVLFFSVDPAIRSRNEVIRLVNELWATEEAMPSPEQVLEAVQGLFVAV